MFIQTISDKAQNPLERSFATPHPAAVNIPPETARAQGHHGIKGAAHGIKGGRPRLDLTEEERAERRRKQQEAWRRRQGIPPKTTKAGPKERRKSWAQDYFDIWGKPPGMPLTEEEFAEREPLWNARVLAVRERIAKHEAEEMARRELRRAGRKRFAPPPVARRPVPPADPSPRVRSSPAASKVGRNSPCPCGSGWKFKKCCGA